MNYRKTFPVNEPKSALLEVTGKLKEIGFKSQESNEHYAKLMDKPLDLVDNTRGFHKSGTAN